MVWFSFLPYNVKEFR